MKKRVSNGVNPIFQLEANVVGQIKVADGSFILGLEAPPIAKIIQPGQFIQIRTRRDSPACKRFEGASWGRSRYDPLLPRPFSIYRVRRGKFLDILYEIVGRGTELMSELKKGDRLSIFGPLGSTFSYPKKRTVSFLVGGGVGLAPFYDLAEALVDPKRGRQEKENVIVLLGVRNREKIFSEKDFKKLGVRFEIATDDGSYGFKGLVTQLLEKHLRRYDCSRPTTHNPRPRLYACGPKPMLCAVARISETYHIPCEVSIDAHMPCGYGICFGCAVKIQTKDSNGGNHISYKLACIDGPVFNAKEIIWE